MLFLSQMFIWIFLCRILRNECLPRDVPTLELNWQKTNTDYSRTTSELHVYLSNAFQLLVFSKHKNHNPYIWKGPFHWFHIVPKYRPLMSLLMAHLHYVPTLNVAHSFVAVLFNVQSSEITLTKLYKALISLLLFPMKYHINAYFL